MHDWLTGMRGGERVLEAILEIVPDATIHTLFHLPGTMSAAIESHSIVTSPLQKLATRVRDYRTLLPFFPAAIAAWDFRKYDLVISSSHCVAKSVDTGGVPHLCYCHTPMRYVWDRFDDYFPAARPIRRAVAMPVAALFRQWDRATASRVDRFVANSSFVQGRIRAAYDRDAAVVHPFVGEAYLDTPLERERGDYHVIVSALVPYKRIALALEAARIGGRRLVVVGDGPMRGELERAAPHVEFAGRLGQDDLRRTLGRARSMILPGVEDFGITVLEALACGTPVVAFGEGGAVETLQHGRHGVFFDEPAAESLLSAMEEAERRTWDRETLRRRAAEFSRARFKSELSTVIAETCS